MKISQTVLQLTERTHVQGRKGYVQCSKGNNSKSRQTMVTVHEFWSLFHQALNLFEVSSYSWNGFQLPEWTLVHGRNG